MQCQRSLVFSFGTPHSARILEVSRNFHQVPKWNRETHFENLNLNYELANAGNVFPCVSNIIPCPSTHCTYDPSQIRPPQITSCDDDSVYSQNEEFILSQKHMNLLNNEQRFNEDGNRVLAFCSQEESTPLSPSLIPSGHYLNQNRLLPRALTESQPPASLSFHQTMLCIILALKTQLRSLQSSATLNMHWPGIKFHQLSFLL